MWYEEGLPFQNESEIVSEMTKQGVNLQLLL